MKKKLYRSARERVLSGVCGGIAEYFDIDVTIVRLVWIITTIAGGVCLWPQLIAAIIIPRNPETADAYEGDAFSQSSETHQQSSDSQEKHYDRSNAALVIGVVLMLIGAFLLLDRFIPIRHIWRTLGRYGWPMLLIIIGFVILITSMRRNES